MIILTGRPDPKDHGVPLAGPLSGFFWGYVSQVGLSRTDCLVLDLAGQWQEMIRRSPHTTVLATSDEALHALTGQKQVTKWRGSVLWSDLVERKVVPTYDPKYLIKGNMDEIPVFLSDVQKAQRHNRTTGPHEIRENFFCPPSFDEAMDCLRYVQDFKPLVAYDIETFNNWIRCFGFAWSDTEACVIPIIKRWNTKEGSPFVESDYHYWNERDELALTTEINKLLSDPTIPKVAQNHSFDDTILAKRWGCTVKGLWFDTMDLWHLIYPEARKSLGYITSILTDRPYHKDQSSGSVDLDEWRYNARDCVATWEIAVAMEKEAKEAAVWDFYHEVVYPAAKALTRAQNRGILIDLEERERQREAVEDGKLERLAHVKELAGDPDFNPDSPKQLIKFLYTDLKLKPRRNRATGKLTADVDALQKAYTATGTTKQQREFLEALLHYRPYKKFLEFLEQPVDPEDGRFKTSFNISGTVNGRISSSKSVWGTGTNLQQLPSTKSKNKWSRALAEKYPFRRIFVADPGYTWIKADLSQAEARVVAWIAPLPELIENFQKPDFDIHGWLASKMYGDQFTKEQRQIAKIGVHGGNYGLGARKAADDFEVALAVAKKALSTYQDELPVKPWWARIGQEIRQNRRLVTPLGRSRTFNKPLSVPDGKGGMKENGSVLRSGLSFVPQAMIADILAIAIAELDYSLEAMGAWVAASVHDELCIVCPTENVDDALPIIKQAMEPQIDIPDQPPLVIPTEIEIGPNWNDCKEVLL